MCVAAHEDKHPPGSLWVVSWKELVQHWARSASSYGKMQGNSRVVLLASAWDKNELTDKEKGEEVLSLLNHL